MTNINRLKVKDWPQNGTMTLKQILDHPKSFLTTEKLRRLEDAYKYDFTDSEACAFAGIGISTLEKYKRASLELDTWVSTAKEFLFSQAKINIAKAVEDEDLDTSKWLLERRQKKLYSPRQEVTGDEGKAVEVNVIMNLLGNSVKTMETKKPTDTTIEGTEVVDTPTTIDNKVIIDDIPIVDEVMIK